MKLYYSPGACSLAPHIAMLEAGIVFEKEKVDLSFKKTEGGEDYLKINPKGYVPALLLDDKSLLTEVAVILEFIADKAPQKNLIPAAGTRERYHLLEWLNFISTELHKGFSPLFSKDVPEEYKAVIKERIGKRLDLIAIQLAKHEFINGQFSIADAYLFTVLRWTVYLKVNLEPWPAITPYLKRVAERPAVQEAMQSEGLVK